MVATMVILTGVSLKMASSIIEETTNDEMTAQLDYQESKVQEIVTEIETKANENKEREKSKKREKILSHSNNKYF